MSVPLQAVLSLEKLILQVALGWTASERSVLQPVAVDIEIDFAKMPVACGSDELDSTICYDQLSQKINRHVSNKEFKLLEYLAQDIFELVCSCLSEQDGLSVTVAKDPPMDNLMRAGFTLKRARDKELS